MTEGQAIELGKRAMAAGWKWQAGAANTFGWRILKAGAQVLRVDTGDHGELLWREDTDAGTPDFRDAATLGILLAQVRERYGDATIHVQFDEEVWQVAFWNPDNFFWSYWPERHFSTEVEALVACLEAAKDCGL